MSSILVVKDLCKSFSVGGIQQHVLTNLNLIVDKGEFVIIMGNSGSGKSTLLYSLSGMDKPSIGDIYYNDLQIDGYSNDQLAMFRRNNCGFVFQDYFLNDNMSLLDNVLLSVFVSRKEKPKYIAKAKELLNQVGIGAEMFHKFPTQLSGGECQRVGFVRAVIASPMVLFADEPTGALNSKSAKEIMDLFNDYNRQGNTIILVTHDIKTAVRGSRILYLKDGIIKNELRLGEYDSEKYDQRVGDLTAFLEQMGW